MNDVKDDMKQRAKSCRTRAEHQQKAAAALRSEADGLLIRVPEMLAEADEWDRIRIAMYGADKESE